MFKLQKVLFSSRSTSFTAHYSVLHSTSYSRDIYFATVHRCPCCGRSEMIVWLRHSPFVVKNGALYDGCVSAFGFRSCNGKKYIQSYCKGCR